VEELAGDIDRRKLRQVVRQVYPWELHIIPVFFARVVRPAQCVCALDIRVWCCLRRRVTASHAIPLALAATPCALVLRVPRCIRLPGLGTRERSEHSLQVIDT
jgi:hypothetical protein